MIPMVLFTSFITVKLPLSKHYAEIIVFKLWFKHEFVKYYAQVKLICFTVKVSSLRKIRIGKGNLLIFVI